MEIKEVPLVSIIIPTYNRSSDLKRAIESILSQTYKNWEVVIVDNHSKDNTDEVVRDFHDSRINLHKIHNNGVIAASRNLGIKNAKGEYIAFLDSDDWWKPKKLEYSVKALEKGADIVYHDLWIVKKANQSIFFRKAKTRKLKEPVYRDLLMNGNGINNSSVVIRSDITRKVGFQSEDKKFIAWEDYEYWLRCANVTEKFERVPNCLGFYWAGGNNISNDERTLRILDDFCTSYASEIKEFRIINDETMPDWVNYHRSLIYFKNKNWKQAYSFIRLVKNVNNFGIKFQILKLILHIINFFQDEK